MSRETYQPFFCIYRLFLELNTHLALVSVSQEAITDCPFSIIPPIFALFFNNSSTNV